MKPATLLFLAWAWPLAGCQRAADDDVASRAAGRDVEGEGREADAEAFRASLHAFCRELRLAWVEDCRWRGEVRCEASADDAFGREVCERVERAIARGRVRFDAELALECASERAFDAVSAWQVGWIPPLLCDGMFAGTARLGEACYPDETFQRVCAEGYCDAAGQCPGVCRPHAREGEKCAPARCEPGWFCDGEGRCRKELEVGAACPERAGCARPALCVDGVCRNVAGHEEPCADDLPCAYPWLCSGGKCKNEVAEGEVCDTDERCPDALGCVFDPPGGSLQRCAERPAGGQACDRRSGCASGFVCISDGEPYLGVCEPGEAPEPSPSPNDAEPVPERTRCWGE